MESPPPSPMQSPLAVFIYVLMREHLPVATVKWMIDQSKLPGVPKFDAPELEQLAQRFAEQLGCLAERPAEVGNDTPEPPPSPREDRPATPPPGEEIVAGRETAAKATARVFAANPGRWMKLLEIHREAGQPHTSNSVRQAVQVMVRAGEVEARGATVKRRYRLVGPTDASEGSARGRGQAVPVDRGAGGSPRIETPPADATPGGASGDEEEPPEPPTDEAVILAVRRAKEPVSAYELSATLKVGEEMIEEILARLASAGSLGRTENEALGPLYTFGAEAPEEDAKPPPAPARAGETDIELMARVSDFIKEASERSEAVWPQELETHFNIDARRRKTIIDLLIERQRIVVRKPGSPHVHYVYRRVSGDPDFSFERDDEDGLGQGTTHLKADPNLERRIASIAERDETARFIVSKHMDTIREWCKGAGNFTARQLRDVFKVSAPTSHRVCVVLQQSGFLEQVSQDGRTGIYAVVGSSNGKLNSARPDTRPLHAGGDGSTLDGRALGVIDGAGGLTVAEIASRLGVSEEVARAVVGRLFSEGEVRTQRQEGTIRYVAI